MVRQLAKGILEFFERISNVEYSERSHQVELIGKYDVDGREKDVICTVQLKHYIPRDVYGEGGHFYDRHRQRLVRNKDRKWVTIDETKTYYEMSEADKKFVYVSYVYHHLTQRQIAKLSGIPQPYVFRYIKHNKLKPKYSKTVNIHIIRKIHEPRMTNTAGRTLFPMPRRVAIGLSINAEKP